MRQGPGSSEFLSVPVLGTFRSEKRRDLILKESRGQLRNSLLSFQKFDLAACVVVHEPLHC